jgi:hypothetical protein
MTMIPWHSVVMSYCAWLCMKNSNVCDGKVMTFFRARRKKYSVLCDFVFDVQFFDKKGLILYEYRKADDDDDDDVY